MIGEIVQDISYKELQLAILRGVVDLSQLRVFQSQQVFIPELSLKINAAIIGTSHYIQFQFDEEILTEMLACNSSKEFGGDTLYLEEIPSIEQTITLKEDKINYSFEHQILNYTNSYDESTRQWQSLANSSPLVHMECEFNRDSLLPSARTLLSVNRRGKTLEVATAHEYQEENVVVWSKSMISTDI